MGVVFQNIGLTAFGDGSYDEEDVVCIVNKDGNVVDNKVMAERIRNQVDKVGIYKVV